MRAFSQRLRVVLRGAVQGVGFRPFVYRLACELGLVGWVNNSAEGVLIEVEGARSQLDRFLLRLNQEQPPRAAIQSLRLLYLDPIGYSDFEIHASTAGKNAAIILPDLATCAECLAELFDPHNRRYRYPFTTCTHCGPRFSIITALPYDRPNTTMQAFTLCNACQREYTDPVDRRFHAQPNACSVCGPHLELWDVSGQVLATHDQALAQTADAIRAGQIVAVKGLGGFHLIVDARNKTAIQRLRHVKHRDAKPFALMYPCLDLVKQHCLVSEREEQLLRSPAAPIVLLQQRKDLDAPDAPLLIPHPSVAPDNPYRGIMLPSTPLHHLLMAELGGPIVATSGNRADEPICTDEQDALQRLHGIADAFLVHDRPIAHGVDDSIVRVVAGQEQVLRRARGYAPWPIQIQEPLPLLAVGAQQKNAIAFSLNQQAFVSQHIGDLDTVLAVERCQKTIVHFTDLYALQPVAIACDMHPDYRSTQVAHEVAARSQIPVISVQHHYAHGLSCMAEHQLDGPALAIAWDGTGYGLDGTLWGGECLHITPTGFQRVAHFRHFGLPGGTLAIQQPRRAALGLLYELFGDALFERRSLAPLQAFSAQERQILPTLLRQKINTPMTSSVGRLFDAIASIIGLRQQTSFEGQAAMALEFALEPVETDRSYPFALLESIPTDPSAPLIIDWAKLVQEIIADQDAGLTIGMLSALFHNTLVETILAVAQHVTKTQMLRQDELPILLTGGCFQNKYLTERAIQRLKTDGFRPYWPQRIPPNDGGIAVGQLLAASRDLSGGNHKCV